MADYPEGYGPLLEQAFAGVVPAGRLFPGIAPDALKTAEPFVIYQGLGGTPIWYREGTLPEKANQRVQLFVWSRSVGQADRLARALLAVAVAHPRMEPVTEVEDDYNETLKLYGRRLDVSVWFNNYT